MKIVFALAMDYEIENIFVLNEWVLIEEKPFKIYCLKKNKDMGLIKTGIGKVNAAAAIQYVLGKGTLKKIINLGLVGCLNKKMKIGEVRSISQSRFFDIDVRSFGYALGQIPKCTIVNYPFPPNQVQLPLAKIISGDSFVANQNDLKEIIELFHPDFIDMEIGAIAHTLYINDKLNILESYKAPSDYADGSAKNDFYENEKQAFKNLRSLASKLLTE